MKEANLDSAADYKKFVKDAKLNINENKKVIATLKLKKVEQSQKVRDKYSKDVLALKKK